MAPRGGQESPAPELGQHTAESLTELGYDAAAVKALSH
jgi:crotonobetainyl-CoA:carnitine CoA-transferase CaiB-like acyl-CoA transferase